MRSMDLRIKTEEWLLPRQGTDLTAWACVACDQYTSQPEYWGKARAFAGDQPSALKLILPECDLAQADRLTQEIHGEMARYQAEGILQPMKPGGLILTERRTESGIRVGLVAAFDLEGYDYHAGSQSLIRPTEGTIEERIPPRLRVRQGAPLELGHVMMLIDDPERSVIEPLYEKRSALQVLYDFPLMMKGGHLKGYALTAPEDIAAVTEALYKLKARLPDTAPLLYAVGDGNHSLATAKAYWEEIKQGLTPAQRTEHPARYAMAELVNLHSNALHFEPIHRVVFGASAEALLSALEQYAAAQGMTGEPGQGDILCVCQDKETRPALSIPQGTLAVALLQAFLDDWLGAHPEASLDYVHGEEAVRGLARQADTVGFLLPSPDKSSLFPTVARDGALPRKTFSMGEAHEKRYYMEARGIV